MTPSKAEFAIPALAPLILGGSAIGLAMLANQKQTLHTKCALVVPLEFHTTDLQYADWNYAQGIVAEWLSHIHDWFITEIGVAPVVDFRLLLSQYTWHQFLGRVTPDSCGDGFDANNIFGFLADELGYPQDEPYKCWYVIVGGGGWAGGNNSHETNGQNSGWSIVGDWSLKWALGIAPPCDPFPPQSTCQVLGHEVLNSMNMDAYHPYLECDSHMTDAQKADLINNNHLWFQ